MKQSGFPVIELTNISKSFNRRKIFDSVSFSINSSNIFAIKGDNGKGKSTILKLILGLERQDNGEINYFNNTNQKIDINDFKRNVAFVSPYLYFYNDLTLTEIVNFYFQIRDEKINTSNFEEKAKLLEIYKYRDEYLKNYSSGMYQRVRILLSILLDLNVYIFDEPTSNLDKNGIDIFFRFIDDLKNKGKTIIFASNEERELELCDTQFSL